MKIISSLLFASLFASLSFAAPTLLTSVTRIGGESGSACTETRTDGTTAACHAIFASGRGTAIGSYYQSGTNAYVWFGNIHRTQTSSINVRSISRATFATEYNYINTTGHGVTLTYGIGNNDVEGLDLYVNDGFGNYVYQETVAIDNTPVTIPYAGHNIDFYLEAIRDGVGDEDYDSLFRVELSAY